ncbi:MAG: hypothetical protein CMK92_03855 [Pseudomonas sp.]|nr:hypothetical protein [Pseudomonas sp.]
MANPLNTLYGRYIITYSGGDIPPPTTKVDWADIVGSDDDEEVTLPANADFDEMVDHNNTMIVGEDGSLTDVSSVICPEEQAGPFCTQYRVCPYKHKSGKGVTCPVMRYNHVKCDKKGCTYEHDVACRFGRQCRYMDTCVFNHPKPRGPRNTCRVCKTNKCWKKVCIDCVEDADEFGRNPDSMTPDQAEHVRKVQECFASRKAKVAPVQTTANVYDALFSDSD